MKMANTQQVLVFFWWWFCLLFSPEKDHSTSNFDVQQAVNNLCKFVRYDRILTSASGWRPPGEQSPNTLQCFNNWFQRALYLAQRKNRKRELQARKKICHVL